MVELRGPACSAPLSHESQSDVWNPDVPRGSRGLWSQHAVRGLGLELGGRRDPRVALGCVFWGLLGVWPFPHCRSRLAVVPAWGGQVHCAQGPGATVETSRAVREEWEWSSAGAFKVFLDRISEELHFLWWYLNITTCPNGSAPRCMKQKLT